jgi:hypothetical protein
MNTKNSFIVVLFFVIIIILIELIFNFRKRLMENFHESVEEKKPQSIISKIDGKMFNVEFDNDIMYIPSPINNQTHYIALNNDGTLVQKKRTSSDSSQQWKLIQIKNRNDYMRELGNSNNNGYNTNSSCINYPFYIVKSLYNNYSSWCLQFNYGKLISRPIGNYDTQKWDVSSIKTRYGEGRGRESNPNICYRECAQVSDSATEIPIGNSVIDDNKIKINFNIKDDFLKQLFPNGIKSNNSASSNENLVPKSAIGSICKGCDPSKL